jgi:hypothetical protein
MAEVGGTLTYEYSEAENLRLLDGLTPEARGVFALVCASRLLPAYRRFHEATGLGDPSGVEALAGTLWAIASSEGTDESSLREAAYECEQLVPSEDEGWDEGTQPYAEDAVAALAYAFRARLTGQAQEAAWAGRRAYEALDHYVRNVLDNKDEAGTLSHPLVQAELGRQRRDLLELAKFEDEAVPVFRRRAEAEAALIFATVS